MKGKKTQNENIKEKRKRNEKGKKEKKKKLVQEGWSMVKRVGL